MIVYISLLVWILLCAIVKNYKLQYGKKIVLKGRTFYLWLAFLAISTVMAIRSPTVGTDTLTSVNSFVYIASSYGINDVINSNDIFNSIFNLFLYGLGMISLNSQVYIFTISLIISIGIAIFIYRASPNVVVSTFLFLTLNLFFIALNTGRQWISIVLALNAFLYLQKNIWSKWGWVLFLVACSIHNVTFSFLPGIVGIYLVKHCHQYKKIVLISIGGTLLCATIFFTISQFFINYFPHYAIYVNETNADNIIENTGGGKIVIEYMMFLSIFVMYSVAVVFHRIQYDGTLAYTIIPSAIFCSIMGFFFFQNTVVNRMLIPYQCLFMILIPYTFNAFGMRTRMFLYSIMGIGLSFSYYLWMSNNLGDVLPYHVFFE